MGKSESRTRELIDLIDYAEQGFSHYRSAFVDLENMYHCVMDKDTDKFLTEAEKSKLYFNKSQAKSRRISEKQRNAGSCDPTGRFYGDRCGGGPGSGRGTGDDRKDHVVSSG